MRRAQPQTQVYYYDPYYLQTPDNAVLELHPQLSRVMAPIVHCRQHSQKQLSGNFAMRGQLDDDLKCRDNHLSCWPGLFPGPCSENTQRSLRPPSLAGPP